MGGSAGQLPDQKAIDSAEQQLALGGTVARTFDVVQYPRQLCAREIRVQQQAGAVGEHLFVARIAQRAALAGGAAVLPDDGVIDRAAGFLVPDHNGLALVGDADGGDIACRDPCLVDRPAAGRLRGAPQIIGIMFNPAGLGEMLGEFFLGAGNRRHRVIVNDGPCGGGALVNGKDIRHARPFGSVATVRWCRILARVGRPDQMSGQ